LLFAIGELVEIALGVIFHRGHADVFEHREDAIATVGVAQVGIPAFERSKRADLTV
jgi:hypothetical protein